MNHACECGHDAADHDTEDGWCGAENDQGQPCICPIYQWGGDD